MNLKTLFKIKRELLQIYKSPQGRKALEFESLAKQLGRYKDNRGKEPTIRALEIQLLRHH